MTKLALFLVSISVACAWAQASTPVASAAGTYSHETLARGDSLRRRVMAMLADARRESDIIRITCLDDKVNQINASLEIAHTRAAALETATDPDQQKHEQAVLEVLALRFQYLDAEASQCVGQDIFEVGSTHIETTIDPSTVPTQGIADSDLLRAPTPDIVVPQSNSPFR